MKHLILSSLLVIVACDNSDATLPMEQAVPMPEAKEPESIIEAKERYPSLFALQTDHIAKTCSPNPGVCHNSNNYPEFRTVGNLIAAISAPCNVEMPDLTQGWDSCEQPGDVLLVDGEKLTIGWTEKLQRGRWELHLRQAPITTQTIDVRIESADRMAILMSPSDWNVTANLVAGELVAEITADPENTFLLDYVDDTLATVLGGDINQNGKAGAEDPSVEPGAMIWPGDPTRSYLWRRLLGDVPGSQMPLANMPLGNAEYAAIACWIESLEPDVMPSPTAPIDYDNCLYAKNPLDPVKPKP